MLSYGGTFKWAGGITTDFIGHYFSALPTTLFLDNQGNTTGEIYMSDITGDGTIRDILPGYKNGAFMRSIKPKDLSGVIANYNLAGAHKLTPAGQALVSNGLMTSAEMTELGAVTRSIAAPPTNNAGNGNMRTFDLTLGRPSKLPWLGGGISVEPTISAFNLFNFSNFGAYGVVGGTGGNLYSSQEPGTPNGTDTSLGSPYNRTAMRNGNGSGVFGQGVARVIEYGLKFNF